ncbi:MAG: prepilin-type N-terminal cleavage/methylation domain-containing protein [Pseudanabaenaceae cyanobacterium SKYGB_i_bin29]|nr:type II secretion system GspH family protein [Pseudanabaenaceae cyanobacterium SKYG29]MDW8421009.1 prepilin-type N-terminal cleavage/methylation domain-containing protein [Pseudanabaenaceae cyanobacterium SKYGB_i_bin29]
MRVVHKWLLARFSQEKGLTLIEALVAVIVLGILLTALLPMVTLAVATRVQARRVDLATQAARSYVEAVRARIISLADIPSSQIAAAGQTTFEAINPPNPATYLPLTDPITGNSALRGTRIDGNNDGWRVGDPFDFVLQPMRTRIIPTPPATGEPNTTQERENALRNQGFVLGVRVYRADGFSGTLYRGLPTEPQCRGQRTVFTRNLGNRACPVVVVRAEILTNTSNTPEILRRLGN